MYNLVSKVEKSKRSFYYQLIIGVFKNMIDDSYNNIMFVANFIAHVILNIVCLSLSIAVRDLWIFIGTEPRFTRDTNVEC